MPPCRVSSDSDAAEEARQHDQDRVLVPFRLSPGLRGNTLCGTLFVLCMLPAHRIQRRLLINRSHLTRPACHLPQVHIDADAFYAQTEEIRNPDLLGRPIAVTQK